MALIRGGAAVLVALGLLIGACSDDDSAGDDQSSSEETPTTDASGPSGHTPTTQQPSTGGLDIPDVPGTYDVPVPDLGFGIAVPEGWEATRLTDEALDEVADAELVRPAFLASARAWAADGAVLYAAGVEDSGAVSDLKVYVDDDVDTSAAGLAERADALVASGDLTDATVAGDPASGRLRVDYTLSVPSADDPEQNIEGVGSVLLVADGNRLWRLIVISESPEAQNALLLVFDRSLTFD